jgi:hypothetical protein
MEAVFPNLPITGTRLDSTCFSAGGCSPILKRGDSSFKEMFFTSGFFTAWFFGVMMELVCCLYDSEENSYVCKSTLAPAT